MRMTTDMQKAAFAHLIGSDYARLTRETTGHLVSRLTNDLTSIQQATQTSMIAFVRDLLSVIAVLIAMLYLDWMLTLIVFAVYPLAVLPMSSIGRRLRSVARRTHTEVGDMTSRLTELLAGARLIKAFRLENYATERLNGNFEQIFRLQDEGRARARPHGPGARGAGRRRHRRRHRLRLLAHRGGHQHGRRFHGLRHRAAAGVAAHQVAGHGGDVGARGPGSRRAHLRAARREAHRRSTARMRGRSLVAAGRHRLRRRRLRLCHRGGQPGRGELLAHRAGRQDGGAGRPLRRRQVDRDQPRGAAVRRGRRPHPASTARTCAR